MGPPVQSNPITPTPDAILAQLERICNSATLERSERLRSFLTYVCEAALRGESDRVSEYVIGVEVFQRGDDFSPVEDSIVRRTAHALRQKLHRYYETEGREDLVRIELPVGRYFPVFHAVGATAPTPTPASLVETETPPPAIPDVAPAPTPQSPSRRAWLAAGAGACAAFVAGWLARGSGGHPALHPVLRDFWQPWIDDPKGVTICLSTPMTTTVRLWATPQAAGNRPVLPDDSPVARALRDLYDLRPGGALSVSADNGQGKLGEAIAAVHLASWISSQGGAPRAIQSRAVRWEDFKEENFILFGHPEINPFTGYLLDKYPLRTSTFDGATRRILNTQPKPGEPAAFDFSVGIPQNGERHTHALISRLPGVDGQRKLLLITGLDSQAVQAAVEFLTDPEALRDLTRTAPGYFQAVLAVHVREKVPVTSKLVLVRPLPNQSPKS
jgi:hypothetical protein